MKRNPSINNLPSFLSSIGYKLSTPKALQEPELYKETIFQVLLYLAKHCLKIQNIKLEFINPELIYLIDVQQHASAIQFTNEFMVLEHLFLKLGMNFRFVTDYFKINKKSMESLIMRLLQYDTYKTEMLDKVHFKLQELKKLEDEYLCHLKKTDILQNQHYRLMERKKAEQPRYSQLMVQMEQKQQSIRTLKQDRTQKIIKKKQLQGELGLIKRTLETKRIELLQVRNQVQIAKSKIAPNIEQVKFMKNSLSNSYNQLFEESRELTRQRGVKLQVGGQKTQQILSGLEKITNLHAQILQSCQLNSKLEQTISGKVATLNEYQNNQFSVLRQQQIANEVCQKLSQEYNKASLLASSNQFKLQKINQSLQVMKLTNSGMQKTLVDMKQINRIHQDRYNILVKEIHTNYQTFKTKMDQIKKKTELYFDWKINNARKMYQNKDI